MSKADELTRALDRLLAASPEIEAAAVVSGDGLPMASALPSHVEEDRLAAMSAALLTLGDRASDGLGRGALQQVFIEGSDGHVILMAAGNDSVLVVVVERGAKIGLVLFEIRRTAAEVAGVMRGSQPSAESLREPEPEPQPASQAPSKPPLGAVPEPDPYYSQTPRPTEVPVPEPQHEVVQSTVNAWE